LVTNIIREERIIKGNPMKGDEEFKGDWITWIGVGFAILLICIFTVGVVWQIMSGSF
jgi:hypothetical protein